MRKVVVATNVAETSITIEGIVYVIDAGRVKETQYEAANNMMHLVETWASRASCKQRRGRAGRTRPGQCFKLFTRKTEATKMQAQQVPELLRTPLEQLCLQVKSMGKEDVKAFLQRAIDPPSVAVSDLRSAHCKQWRRLIAYSERGELTPSENTWRPSQPTFGSARCSYLAPSSCSTLCSPSQPPCHSRAHSLRPWTSARRRESKAYMTHPLNLGLSFFEIELGNGFCTARAIG